MFVKFKIVTLLIAVSLARSTPQCTDTSSQLIEIPLFGGGHVEKNCAEAVPMRPEICLTDRVKCCKSCKKLKDSRPNAPDNCPYGDVKGSVLVGKGTVTRCQYIYETNNEDCSDPSVKQQCCDTCTSKYGSCKDLSEEKTLQLTRTGKMFGCPYIRNNTVDKFFLCKIEMVRTQCCKSCISSGCNDLTDKKVFDLKGWEYGCRKLLSNSLFQSTQCGDVDVAGLCCRSCNSTASGECKDLTKVKFFNIYDVEYGCDDILGSTYRKKMCANDKVKGICCQSCRDQN